MNAAEQARDAGIALVSANSKLWQERALNRIPFCPLPEFTGEDLRVWLTPRVGTPHHANAYGALIKIALTKGLIQPTGEWRKMKLKASHARRTPVYTRVVKRWSAVDGSPDT